MTRSPSQLAVFGMLVSVLLASVKLIAGLLGNSYALVADAIESFSDIISSAVILGGLRVSQKPASEKHPYGYGKAEPLAALAVSGIIFAAGLAVVVQAIREILTPHHAPAPFTLAVLLIVIVAKEVLFRMMLRSATQEANTAIHTEAWHHRADAMTSAAAAIGISVALVGGSGWEAADDVAALFAGGIILTNALFLMRTPIRELLDVQVEHVVEQAREIASGVPGVRRIQKVYVRKSGPNYLVDMHVWVDPSMNIHEAHRVGHAVKDAIKGSMKNVFSVMTHLEPDDA